MARYCETCQHWSRWRNAGDAFFHLGNCRRLPPIAPEQNIFHVSGERREYTGLGRGLWPVTTTDDWCGEYDAHAKKLRPKRKSRSPDTPDDDDMDGILVAQPEAREPDRCLKCGNTQNVIATPDGRRAPGCVILNCFNMASQELAICDDCNSRYSLTDLLPFIHKAIEQAAGKG